MASPQYPIMKCGSTVVDVRNASNASSYQNECSAARPRRKCCCACSEPEVGNSTSPNLDSRISASAGNAAMTDATSKRQVAREIRRNIMQFTLSKSLLRQPLRHGRPAPHRESDGSDGTILLALTTDHQQGLRTSSFQAQPPFHARPIASSPEWLLPQSLTQKLQVFLAPEACTLMAQSKTICMASVRLGLIPTGCSRRGE